MNGLIDLIADSLATSVKDFVLYFEQQMFGENDASVTMLKQQTCPTFKRIMMSQLYQDHSSNWSRRQITILLQKRP